jgi:hypothetical protein
MPDKTARADSVQEGPELFSNLEGIQQIRFKQAIQKTFGGETGSADTEL